MRLEYDAGRYERIRELSPHSSKEDLTKAYTWRGSTTGQRAALNQREQKYPDGEVQTPVMFSDPLENGQGVDPRHEIILQATRERAARLREAAAEHEVDAGSGGDSNSGTRRSAKL
jgi:hypothetical protein|eukprot:COSAG06_NODE_3596_length_5138_cov_7.213534_8_plen_116_part_00